MPLCPGEGLKVAEGQSLHLMKSRSGHFRSQRQDLGHCVFVSAEVGETRRPCADGAERAAVIRDGDLDSGDPPPLERQYQSEVGQY